NALRTEIGGRLEAIEAIRHMTPVEAARVVRAHTLTREMLPTELLTHAVVWDALLDSMPLGALVRNLGVMTKVGLLEPGSHATRSVVARLSTRDAIRRARLHPLGLLAAVKTYAQGRGARGDGKWSPVSQVIDALDQAFYLSFETVAPTGKRM